MRSLSRRDAIKMAMGLAALAACRAPADGDIPAPALPRETPLGAPPVPRYADNVDALCDVLLPAEVDKSGKILSPGAREASPDKVMRIEDFAPLAAAQGLVPPLSDETIAALGPLGAAFRAALDADLDALALEQRPLTPFRDLPRALQEAAVARAFADDARRPAMLVVRAACFTAYLGAVDNDLGLREIGFPPFEDFKDGRAVSGYPRTRAGRLIDAAKEDLAKLAAAGDLDDYTYNLAPEPTPGDDLSAVLDAAGDLL